MKGDKAMSFYTAAHEAVDRTCADCKLSGMRVLVGPSNIALVFDFIKVFFEHLISVLKECLDDK